VAITAQESQVLQPVIEPVTVDVMQGKRDRTTAPLDEAAIFANRLLYAFVKEPHFQVVTVRATTHDEVRLNRALD